MKKQKKYKLNLGFITQKIGKKTTIFSGENSILYTLNDTAAYIFQGLKLGWDRRKIINGITDKYKISDQEVEEDISELIKELKSKKIISEL